MRKLLNWREVPPGATIIEPGNAVEYETGSWRTYEPVWYEDRCIQCYLCWVYCPDSSIMVEDSKVAGIDYDHCKGCGICAQVCPPKANAIEMKLEEK